MPVVTVANKLMDSPSVPLGITLSILLALNACQKSEQVPTTAERLKNVEVRQKTEPESYLPRKSVDYMATMKDLKDVPQKPAEAKPEPKASMAVAPVAPPAAAPAKLTETVKTPAVEPRPAPVANPVAPPVVSAPVVADAPKKADAPKADGASAQVEGAYFASLRTYINSVKRYPSSREARSLRPSGTVQIGLELTREGKMKDAVVEKTSESIILDQAALSTVRQGSYPAFPTNAWPGQGSRRFSLSLEYSLAAGG